MNRGQGQEFVAVFKAKFCGTATKQKTIFRGENREFRGDFAVQIVRFAAISRLKSQFITIKTRFSTMAAG